jgi:lipoic acid synthetase
VDIVTLGQYLRPTPKHAAVERYVSPEQFAIYEREGRRMGFQFVASGPLVRSSYHAAEAFVAAAIAPVAAATEAAPASGRSASEPAAVGEDRPVAQSRGVGAGQLLRLESLVRR